MKLDPQRRLVQELVARRGLDLKTVSLAIGRNHAYLQQYLKRGKPRRLPEEARRAFAALFEVDQEALAHGEEVPLAVTGLREPAPSHATSVAIGRVTVPVGLGGGGYLERDESAQAIFAEQLIRHDLRAKPDDLRYMEVRGQSMYPTLQHGDQILIDCRDTDPAQEGIFVLWDGEGLVCKWVSRVHGADPPRLRLQSENERFATYEPMAEECRIFGRVIWFARRL